MKQNWPTCVFSSCETPFVRRVDCYSTADTDHSVAGADSSAYAMTTILLSLLTNPQTYIALRCEIDAAIASGTIDDSDNPISEAEAKKTALPSSGTTRGFAHVPTDRRFGLDQRILCAGWHANRT